MASPVTVPIGRLHKVDGISVVVAAVVVTDDDMTLHMTLQPCPESLLDWWFDPQVWRVDDGLGTPYEFTAGGSRGNDQACHASCTWTPAPPTVAVRVTFEARKRQAVVLSQWVSMAHYRDRAG